MSIDGVKIIDSDLANDIYSEFMSLYDENYSIGEIRNKIIQWESNLNDGIEVEIFFTTYGFALWEIGAPTEDIIKQIESVIRENKTEELWAELDEDLAVKRKREIQKLIKKISTPKETPRPRKKYRQIKNYIFKIGDCLAIKTKSNSYLLCLIANNFQNKNNFNYGFVFIIEKFNEIPKENIISTLSVYGRRIPSSIDKKGYFLGLDYSYVEHSDLIKIKDDMQIFGHVLLNNEKYDTGSFSYSENIAGLIKTNERIKKKFFKENSYSGSIPEAGKINIRISELL